MIKHLWPLLLTLLLPIVTVAEDSPAPLINFPAFSSSPVTPPPPPHPDSVPVLLPDTYYVFDGPVEYVADASTIAGEVEIETTEISEKFSLKIIGKFFDSNGKSEARTISSLTPKWVTIVKGVKLGRVEITATPIGFTSRKQIQHLVMDVFEGKGPRPPPQPTPVDPVDPVEPLPPPAPLVSQAFVAIICESDGRPATLGRAIEAAIVSIQGLGHQAQVFDPQDKISGTTTLVVQKYGYEAAVKARGVSYPAMLVIDPKAPDPTKRVLAVKPLPGTEAEIVAETRKAVGQ